MAYAIMEITPFSEVWNDVLGNDGMQLRHIKDHYMLTTDHVKTAIEQNGMALKFVPQNLMKPDVLRIALKQNGMAIEYIPFYILTEYPDLCEIAATQNGFAVQHMTGFMLCELPHIYKMAVAQNGLVLQIVYPSKRTFDVCVAAVTQNRDAIEFVPSNIKDDVMNTVNTPTQVTYQLI